MKKFLSILTVPLVIAAMLHFSVARHYCGGELVAARLTLSGAPATCGMENGGGICRNEQNGEQIKSHCCDDVINSYSVDNIYTPASKAVSCSDQVKFQAPVIFFEKPAWIASVVDRLWSDSSPPGEFLTSEVNLQEVRVFRI